MKIISLRLLTLRLVGSGLRLVVFAALLMGTSFGQSVNKGGRQLAVSVIPDKTSYEVGDRITLEVLLTNTSSVPVYLYAYLARGESASLSVWLNDAATGKDIPQTVIADSITPPPPSKDIFVKLLPGHVYGVSLKSSVADLGVEKGGRYRLIAQYHSPVPSSRSFGLPIWSMEDGAVSSSPVTITVGD